MKLLCIGDSLTRGQVSSDYVAMLSQRLPSATVVNAGVNAEPSAVLAARLPGLVERYRPTVVTVLTGTNDMRAILNDRDLASLRKRWSLTTDPTPDAYRAALTAIVRTTATTTALLSPPTLGDNLDSTANVLAGQFAAIAREVAIAEGATYLPLFELTIDALRQKGPRPGAAYRPGATYAARAAMRHFFLRQSLDTVSRSRGLLLTTDTVHLNSQGAAIVADLAEAFVRGDRPSTAHS
jgi:lysophospholipase L1-like esterase